MQEELKIKITADTDNAQKNINDTKKDVQDFDKQSDESSKAVDEAFASLKDAIANSMKAVGAAIAAGTAAVIGLAESTREYRTAQAKLVTAFETAGASAETATAVYEDLQGVLGDTDVAVEAAAHLAKLTTNEEDLAEWTDVCTGIYATFGDSLPIEGLTEAANETAKVGTLTGSLADALNWAGVNEEEFQKKLDACNNEAEREALIRKTLNGLYKSASGNYKTNSKDIIAANKAQEKLNKSMADIGKTMEPVLTELKELGASLLEDAKEPLQAVAKFISGTVIPTIKNVSNWVKNNKGLVIGMVTGLTTAFIGYKVATLAAKAAEEGVTIATIARTAAQKALNLVMAATPTGLLLTGLAALTVGLVAYGATTEKAEQETKDYTKEINNMNGAVITVSGNVATLKSEEEYLKTATNDAAAAIKGQTTETTAAKDETVIYISKIVELTEEEKAVAEKARDAAGAFKEQKDATSQAMGEINSQMSYVTNLANELFRLADNSGKVKKADEARASFIVNELNKHLGTEYQITGGIIKNYQELEKEIYDVINAKTAQMLIDETQDDYLTAIKNEQGALEALQTSYTDYTNTLATNSKAIEDNKKEIEKSWDTINEANENGIALNTTYLYKYIADLETQNKELEKSTKEKKEQYEKDAANYASYSDTINDYEYAMMEMQKGNYQTVIDMYAGKAAAANEYSGELDEATKKNLDILYNEAIEAGIAAEQTKINFENGVEGYTWEMAREADAAYVSAFKEWNGAYDKAYGIGGDMDAGVIAGLESQRKGLTSKATSIINTVISAMKKAGGINSPSKKTRALAINLGEGAEIGLEESKKDVVAASADLMKETLIPMKGIIDDVSWNNFGSIFDSSALKRSISISGGIKGNSGINATNMVKELVSALGGANTPIVLNVDGKVFAETSINTLNQRTKQTGRLDLVIA